MGQYEDWLNENGIDSLDAKNLELFFNTIPENGQFEDLYRFRSNSFQELDNIDKIKYKRGIKRYSYSSKRVEKIDYFVNSIGKIRKEYKEEFNCEVEKEQRKLFFTLIKDWIDGLRNVSTRIKCLKKDIFDYLLYKYPTLTKSHIFSEEYVDKYPNGGLENETIDNIIQLNQKYLERYYGLASEYYGFDIYDYYMFRRGINIKKILI
jgi:hypothetical protein